MSSPAESLSPGTHPLRLRFVTAASLFDGHDASINIMRRILQSGGVEVIHLGHNRSVAEIVNAAIQEDAHAIAISSYQGGHVEYFKYMIDCLRERDAADILVFGGGGGVIVPDEIEELHAYGVAKIYSPQDGQAMGLQGMIQHMIDTTAQQQQGAERVTDVAKLIQPHPKPFSEQSHGALAKLLSRIENDKLSTAELNRLAQSAQAMENKAPVLGITGTGGAGKSSVTDELIRRLRLDQDNNVSVALLAIDPSRLPHMIDAARLSGVDLIIVETPGIGQGDAGIVTVCDVSLYVMTPEFGAASQLEKIDMLDFADVVAINKFERKGGADALRDVRKQVQRNREAFSESVDNMPVFGTIAALFNDDGVTALYQAVISKLNDKGLGIEAGQLAHVDVTASTSSTSIIPPKRQRYLSEIADSIRDYHSEAEAQAVIARELQQLKATQQLLGAEVTDASIEKLIQKRETNLSGEAHTLLAGWPEQVEAYSGSEHVVERGGKTLRTALKVESLSGTSVSRVALPRYSDHGDLLQWLMRENLPGHFPFTAGVFPFKREGEDPTRMFAGEGDPLRTNKRFKALSEHSSAKRLSTAFDSVTLYGNDPATRPDIYGKVGNSGVSIATVEDMQVLYDGFDLCDPSTSVSMTINGPAPTILAFFFITAFRQQLDVFKQTQGREPDDEEIENVRTETYTRVRGTVQADILKEDQGQNTCIFSTEYSLKMMASTLCLSLVIT